MNKYNVARLATGIKNSIDWEFDLYSGYQEMMRKIDELADLIIEEVQKDE